MRRPLSCRCPFLASVWPLLTGVRNAGTGHDGRAVGGSAFAVSVGDCTTLRHERRRLHCASAPFGPHRTFQAVVMARDRYSISIIDLHGCIARVGRCDWVRYAPDFAGQRPAESAVPCTSPLRVPAALLTITRRSLWPHLGRHSPSRSLIRTRPGL